MGQRVRKFIMKRGPFRVADVDARKHDSDLYPSLMFYDTVQEATKHIKESRDEVCNMSQALATVVNSKNNLLPFF